jgi:putative PIN family toxin of toxin-antitoxin system
MRVVTDTNVLISGIFFGGPPAQILKAWYSGTVQFVVSNEILEEYYEVCERLSLRYPNIEITQILVLIAQNSQVVKAPPLPEPVSSDLDDDKFLACAVASGTKVIISGDSDLLTVSGYENVQVMAPREFADRYIS